MSTAASARHVVVLAPMPLEMDAITTAFGLSPQSEEQGAHWTGQVGQSQVTAVHICMGPPLTRAAITRLLDEPAPGSAPIDHIMIAGICGGIDPDLAVGTLINPETLVDFTSGATYRHHPPGDVPMTGKLMTTEGVTLDNDLSRTMHDQGFVGVDMESSAVAEMCEARGLPWSVYRCIGDRWVDGLLDPRIVALTNPDGSGDSEAIAQLVASEPQLAANLNQLMHDTAHAAQLAAEAAVRGCLALDG
jgi:nucleoside phosphorylase